MISLQDCIALCGLTEPEVLALAEHEHIPEIVAAALAQQLLCQSDGCRKIAGMIADDVRHAAAIGDGHHANELLQTLVQFVATHPEARASERATACLLGTRASHPA